MMVGMVRCDTRATPTEVNGLWIVRIGLPFLLIFAHMTASQFD